jgi:hypothetical protein
MTNTTMKRQAPKSAMEIQRQKEAARKRSLERARLNRIGNTALVTKQIDKLARE